MIDRIGPVPPRRDEIVPVTRVPGRERREEAPPRERRSRPRPAPPAPAPPDEDGPRHVDVTA